VDAEAEWACLEPVVRQVEDAARDPGRGGRPRRTAGPAAGRAVHTSTGYRLVADSDARGHLIRIEGRGADRELIDTLIGELTRLLERP
jgi:ParB family chromosome partitioning protein